MSSSKNTPRVALAALVGAAVGVVAGILIAPRSGAETREKVAQAAEASFGQVADTLNESVSATCADVAQTAQEAGEKTDELREKIAAARARMDQMRADIAKNADQVADKAADVMASEQAEDASKSE